MTRCEIREKSLQSMIEAVRVQGDALVPRIYWFEHGFDAAWEALMAEFRPLITDLRTNAEIGQHFLRNEPWLNEAQADAKAVERLRELVREG